MKKKYILPIALLTLAISGCTDLDVDVKSFHTEYPDSEIAIEAKTSDVYMNDLPASGQAAAL